MILASTTYQSVLLALKLAFLVLLYLFIWRIVRTAGRVVTVSPQGFAVRPGPVHAPRRLVVARSPILTAGEVFELESAALTIGRGGQNDVALDGDEFASARHVRVEPRPDGVWVHDLGSTNGTYVNEELIEGPRLLVEGDVLRVGETELRLEA